MMRYLIALLAVLLLVLPASAVVFGTSTSSEGCIAWSYTPTTADAGHFTELLLDGYVVHNLSFPDNPDHGYVILCGFEPNTCHRLDASNESDAGAYATDVACTTGFDWDAKYLATFIFVAWFIFLVLVEWKMDVIYGIMNLIAGIFAYRNEVLMGYAAPGVANSVTLDIVMVLVSFYVIIMVFKEYLRRRGENIRAEKGGY